MVQALVAEHGRSTAWAFYFNYLSSRKNRLRVLPKGLFGFKVLNNVVDQEEEFGIATKKWTKD
ncbi:hypothetical protein [Salinivirga cyanobacteriivorans]|uniref:hypothetical protein n=1 Tax=Salinivirga cyanobacteriivorans TaxID=1307839 RepID=UPI000716C985|nr:hypothetical protein [Salinivirga cyanobacteriivorans]